MPRSYGRQPGELRPVRITRDFLEFAEGSVLVEFGKTKVIVSAAVHSGVPSFLRDTGRGWLTAEYAMLPKSVRDRIPRGRTSGRSYEIQRLIGRSLRAVTDLTAYGEQTIYVDCDVIQADGGTRSASITGAYVAVYDAFRLLDNQGLLTRWPLKAAVAAVSVGLLGENVALDLDYQEDSQAEVDLNIVMTNQGGFVEVQGTAEGNPFGRTQLDGMLEAGRKGIDQLFLLQRQSLGIASPGNSSSGPGLPV